MMFIGFILFGIVLYYLLKDNVSITNIKKTDSLDILNRRLANGEISIDEYERTKELLKR